MIQFNLLPDIKIQYLQIQRLKHLVYVGSILLCVISLVAFGLLVTYVDVGQKIQLNNLNQSVDSYSRKLTSNTNLNDIMTVQNQIDALPNLEQQDPVASRIFNFLLQLTPNKVTISSLSVSFTPTNNSTTPDSIDVQGNADSAATVNQFVDTLKFTNYTVSSTSQAQSPAFSNVVLTAFSPNLSGGVNYTIDCNFDPTIFSVLSPNVQLIIPPGKITTRSVIAQPTDLFVKSTNPTKSNSGSGQ